MIYYLEKNGVINASCVTTQGNELFHGRIKVYLKSNETIERCRNAVGKFTMGEMIARRLKDLDNVRSRAAEYKN